MVTVFTFPLRGRGARGEGGALHGAVYSHGGVRMCVYGATVRGLLRIIALQSFLDPPNGVLMSQEGFECCLLPLNVRGITLFFIPSVPRLPPSPPQPKHSSIRPSRSQTT